MPGGLLFCSWSLGQQHRHAWALARNQDLWPFSDLLNQTLRFNQLPWRMSARSGWRGSGLEGQAPFGLPPHTPMSPSLPPPPAGVWGSDSSSVELASGKCLCCSFCLSCWELASTKAPPGRARRALQLGGSGGCGRPTWGPCWSSCASSLLGSGSGRAGWGNAGRLVPPPVPQPLKSRGEGVK